MIFLEMQKAGRWYATSSLLRDSLVYSDYLSGLKWLEKEAFAQTGEKVSTISNIPCLGFGYNLILDVTLMSAGLITENAFPAKNQIPHYHRNKSMFIETWHPG